MKLKSVILAGMLVLCIGAAVVVLDFYQYATMPAGASEKTAVLWIKPGQKFSETAAELYKLGLVRHPKKFHFLARLRGSDTRLQAGEFALCASMPPVAILDALVEGDILLRKAAVPEGATILQVGQLLEKAGLISQEAFLKAAADPALIRNLQLAGPTLEGYLFPETYYFPRGVTAEQVIRKMVAHFRSVFTAAWAERAQAMGFTTHQVVTLASIVEKETAAPEERPLIAAVFLNRLKRGMRLESDPTVIYGMKDFKGNLKHRDLATPTPYNTYQIRGLPPGPIANPGCASLEAVLYPSEAPYLYFVSKNNGSHHFSSTLAQHNKMVQRYQRRRR